MLSWNDPAGNKGFAAVVEMLFRVNRENAAPHIGDSQNVRSGGCCMWKHGKCKLTKHATTFFYDSEGGLFLRCHWGRPMLTRHCAHRRDMQKEHDTKSERCHGGADPCLQSLESSKWVGLSWARYEDVGRNLRAKSTKCGCCLPTPPSI